MSQLNGDNFAFSTLIKQSPTLEDIYKAYLKCRKNKRYKVASIKYEKNLWQNLAYLENAIKNFSYSASKPFVFSVKKPKPREIVAAKFTDRVAHHLLVSSLEEQVEKKLHPNCVACRKNRGNKKGNQILKKIFVSDDANKYYWLKLDIKNFFPSIHRETLFNLLKPYFNYNWQYFLAQQIIFQDFSNSIVLKSHKIYLDKLPKFRSLRYKSLDYGLPIGNLTSQFWANLYLNEMDHFIASQDFVFEYLRFVDDFIIFSKNKDKLISFKKNIIDFLKAKRHLQLKDPNAQILPTKYSLNFLGYIYRFKQKTVKKQVKKRLEARIKKFKKQERSKYF